MISFEELHSQTAFEFAGITLLPHYLLEDTYVQPGYINSTRLTVKTFRSADLIRAGAKPVKMMLWKRGSFGEE